MAASLNALKNRRKFFVDDRIFWIYCLISLFFTILGVVYLSQSGQYLILPWILANGCLLYCAYVLSLAYAPFSNCSNIELYDEKGCIYKSSWMWIFVNLIYLAILVVSLLWCTEYSNEQAGLFRSTSTILVIIGGFALLALARNFEKKYNYFSPFFWLIIAFILIWLVLAYQTIL